MIEFPTHLKRAMTAKALIWIAAVTGLPMLAMYAADAAGYGEGAYLLIYAAMLPLMLVAALWLKRETRSLQARALAHQHRARFGVPMDLASIRAAPARLELLRGDVRRVHWTRMVEMSASEAGVSADPLWTCAVELGGGELVDLSIGRDEIAIEEGSRWLAEQLGVKLVDFTYGAPIERDPWEYG